MAIMTKKGTSQKPARVKAGRPEGGQFTEGAHADQGGDVLTMTTPWYQNSGFVRGSGAIPASGLTPIAVDNDELTRFAAGRVSRGPATGGPDCAGTHPTNHGSV